MIIISDSLAYITVSNEMYSRKFELIFIWLSAVYL